MTALRFALSLASGLVFLAAASAEETRGRILQIDSDKNVIRMETRPLLRGGLLDLKIDAKTEILIGGQAAKLNDLAPGRRIRVVYEVRGGKATARTIRAFGLNLAQPQRAAPPPAAVKEGDGVSGTLQRVSAVEREIVVISPGAKGAETETVIAVAKETAILREGKKIAFDELKEGETASVKTESRKGRLTAISIQVGKAQARPENKSATPPRLNLIPRLRQVLERADALRRDMEEQGIPRRDRP